MSHNTYLPHTVYYSFSRKGISWDLETLETPEMFSLIIYIIIPIRKDIVMVYCVALALHEQLSICTIRIYSCNKYSNLIGQLEDHCLLMDFLRDLISRSNVVPPRVMKDAQCNSSHIPRSNVMDIL